MNGALRDLLSVMFSALHSLVQESPMHVLKQKELQSWLGVTIFRLERGGFWGFMGSTYEGDERAGSRMSGKAEYSEG